MSAWLFDLGNSRLKFAPLAPDGSVGKVSAIAHEGGRFVDGWTARLPTTPEYAWLCCVGPPVLRDLLVAELRARGCDSSVMGPSARFGGVTVAYRDPARLGTDRLLAMAAAHARGDGAAVVVGVGTALTVDLVDAAGLHLGGRIAPSPTLMRDALRARAPQLPAEGGDYVEFAADTTDALASGCLGAAIGLVERSLHEASLSVPEPVLWLHGGGAAPLLPYLPGARHAPALVLEGLALWARDTQSAG